MFPRSVLVADFLAGNFLKPCGLDSVLAVTLTLTIYRGLVVVKGRRCKYNFCLVSFCISDGLLKTFTLHLVKNVTGARVDVTLQGVQAFALVLAHDLADGADAHIGRLFNFFLQHGLALKIGIRTKANATQLPTKCFSRNFTGTGVHGAQQVLISF